MKRIREYVLFSAAMVLLLFYCSVVSADDDKCRGKSCNDITIGGIDVETTLDANNETITETEFSSFALGTALGASSIRECLATKQFSLAIFGKQGTKLNKWCAAARYNEEGNFEIAAKLRCSIKEIAKLYPTAEACIEQHEQQTLSTVVAGFVAQHESTDIQQHELILAQQRVINTLTERIAVMETKLNRPRPVQRVVAPPPIQQPLISADQLRQLRIEK